MAISIDFINISTNFLGKQTNNSDQGAIIRWSIVPQSAWPIVSHVAKLKVNVAQGKFILEFAVILVKQCRQAMATISVKSRLATFECKKL